MFRPAAAAVDHAQPAIHLLRVPIVEAGQVGLEVEGHEGVFLSFRRIVARTASGNLDGGDIDGCGGRGGVDGDAQRRQQGDEEGDGREEAEDILKTHGGRVHCRSDSRGETQWSAA